MALLIARSIPDTTVDTITLSLEQAEHVTKLVEEDRRRWQDHKHNGDVGLVFPVGDRVRVHVMDFRSMPKRWGGVFDRVVSIEMVEAIGKDMYEVRAKLSPPVVLPTDGIRRGISPLSTGLSNEILALVLYKVLQFRRGDTMDTRSRRTLLTNTYVLVFCAHDER